jgi:energy-coupling factor transporter ATP-binding protein EcfA2
MILKVSFRNFKVLRHVDIDLEQFTVIVGPNASGKSTILEGLHLMFGDNYHESIKQARGTDDLLSFTSRNPSGPVELSFQSEENEVLFHLTPIPSSNGDDPSVPKKPKWRTDVKERSEPGGNWMQISNVKRTLGFRTSVFLRLDTSHLAAPSYSEHPKPRLNFTGEGLPSFLAYMALNQPDEFAKLQNYLRMVIPTVQRIRFDRVPISKTETVVIGAELKYTQLVQREYMGDSLVFDFVGASDIPGSMASQGTILVLGLLTAILGADSPTLILLDDLEQGLHPKAQQQLVEVIRILLKQNPEIQVVATAHSPYLLDHFQPEEVRITALSDDGITICGRLDEHPDFERWKDEMAAGEFWSLIGENWLKKIPQEATANGV